MDPKEVVAAFKKEAQFHGEFSKRMTIDIPTEIKISGIHDSDFDEWNFTIEGLSDSQAHDMFERANAGKETPEELFDKKTHKLILNSLPDGSAMSAWKNAMWSGGPDEVKFHGAVHIT